MPNTVGLDDNNFKNIIDKKLSDKIEVLYKNTSKNNELEFMFNNYRTGKNMLGMEKFSQILEYMKIRANRDKLEIKNNVSLDIIYSEKINGKNFRITVDGLPNVNKYMEMLHNRKNHVIFSSMIKFMGSETPEITLISKKRDIENIIDIDDYDIRVRFSDENEVDNKTIKELSKLHESERQNIIFRYKHRATLVIKKDNESQIVIDITSVKQNSDINRLEKTNSRYELELELLTHKKQSNLKNLDIIYDEITKILKVLQQSNFLISNSQQSEILNVYADLLNVDKTRMTKLEGRSAQSLEVQHIVDQLPNKYAVTDKADGERYFLIIYNKNVYLISFNLQVKYTGIKISDAKYNNTILDGEYIYMAKHNRHSFMIFDCLYAKGVDVRPTSNFIDRIKYADDVVKNCFVFKGQKGFGIKEYDIKKFNVNEILEFNSKQIDEYMANLNHDILKDKTYLLVRRKYFIPVFGAQDNEIFKYSELLWNKYVLSPSTECPYILDGLIYHPLDQKYITSVKESKYVEYKWKPPTKNSIDFYVQFEKDRHTGKAITLYDNSNEGYSKDKPYRVAFLYVGKRLKTAEQPVLFQEENNRHAAYLFLDNGQIRDEEGEIIQDNTVVEFTYSIDPAVPDKYRWIPLRTRHDKTESVKLYRTKYGNYFDVANRVWRSISNPILISDFNLLANDKTFDRQINLMRNKIDHSVIMSERKENIYYQIKTNLAKPMRQFHNWLKSILIYTHCNPIYEQDRNFSILDIGCGRGGDLMKFYYGKVDFYVGFDLDNNGITSPTDGAMSRYNQLRKTHDNFPRCYFVHADGGALLDYTEQVKVLGSMSQANKALYDKFFSLDPNKRTMFDRLNCQFVIHYFLMNDTVWNNFTQNVSMYCKPGGYFLISTFDCQRITDELKDKDHMTSYYTNTKGEKKILFDIVKKYKDQDGIYGTNNAIDIHNSLFSQENVYITEYLVDMRFLVKELDDKCDMELVETDLFDNQFQIHRTYFKDVVKFESKAETKKFLLNAAEYYDQTNEVNKACYELTKLNRYYVFRKRDYQRLPKNLKGGKSDKTSIKQPVDMSLTEVKEYLESSKYIKRVIPEMGDYSFVSAIHDVLVNSDIIPKSVDPFKLCEDINVEVERDDFAKKLIIAHEIVNSNTDTEQKQVQDALNGINIFVFENDCNDDTDISAYSKLPNNINKASPTILLLKDGSKYYPIYKIRTNKQTGLFDSKTKLIKRLADASDKQY